MSQLICITNEHLRVLRHAYQCEMFSLGDFYEPDLPYLEDLINLGWVMWGNSAQLGLLTMKGYQMYHNHLLARRIAVANWFAKQMWLPHQLVVWLYKQIRPCYPYSSHSNQKRG